MNKERIKKIDYLLAKYYDSEDSFEQTDLAIQLIQGHMPWLTKQVKLAAGMDYYNPKGNNAHTLLYTFQFEEAFAKVFTTMGGNCQGGSVMDTALDCGMSVPSEHELTRKHVIFLSDEDEGRPFREVGEIVFHYRNGDTLMMELEDASNYLIGVQIINCEEE